MNEMVCPVCKDSGWVCEEHPDRAWLNKNDKSCCDGAGQPCGYCNPCTGPDDPPFMPPGFKERKA